VQTGSARDSRLLGADIETLGPIAVVKELPYQFTLTAADVNDWANYRRGQ
jgi:hypothetical protein